MDPLQPLRNWGRQHPSLRPKQQHHKLYNLEITAFNEVRKRIVSILDDVIILFYRWFYDTAARGSLVYNAAGKF